MHFLAESKIRPIIFIVKDFLFEKGLRLLISIIGLLSQIFR